MLRPRELRIGHQDEKTVVSIRMIFKERGKFSITEDGSMGLQQTVVFDVKRSSIVDNICNR